MITITDQSSTIKFTYGNGDDHILDKDSLSIKKKWGFVFIYGDTGDYDQKKLRLRWQDVQSPVVASSDELVLKILEYKANVADIIGDVRITDGEKTVDLKTNPHTSDNEILVNMVGHVCEGNSTQNTLSIDESFTGSWEDTIDYGSVIVGIRTDQPSAEDGLRIQWSINGVDICDEDVFTIDANIGKVFTFAPARRYFRVVYTNNGIAENSLSLETTLRRYYVKPSSHRIQDNIVSDDDAELVKAVITGQSPAGEFDNVQITRNGNFKVSIDEYGDTPAIDSFGRLRISDPFTLYDSKQLHDKQPLFWDEIIGGAATSTHNPINADVEMVIGASASDYVIRQTKQRFNYQPGKSQLSFLTFYAPQTGNSVKRIGLFDGIGVNYLTPNNGVFFEVDGTVSWNIAKNGTITERIDQSNWSVDKLDGTGLSGKTLDLDAPQILVIDYEWLGVGRVRVGFVIDGLIFYVHNFYHANKSAFDSVYMSTPNLPVRYSIEGNGNGIDELDHICSTVMSEGGLDETGLLRSINTGTAEVSANVTDTPYAILGVRLKSTYKDITVIPEFLNVIDEQGGAFKWELCLNPTISGTFTYSDITNSALQSAKGAGATVTDKGIIIDSGYVGSGGTGNSGSSAGAKIVTSLRMGTKIDGTQDTIVLVVTPLSSNQDTHASLTLRELL